MLKRRFFSMKKSLFFLFLVIIALLVISCKKTDITPAYLLLSEKDFEDCIEDDLVKFNKAHEKNYDEEQFNAIRQQSFKDVLVSINGKELGYWKLPCKIPLLPNYSAQNNIRIIPCTRVPKTSLTTVPYYFLQPVERFFDLEKGDTCEFKNVKFEYVSGIDFPILETFSKTTPFKPLDTIFKAPMEIVYNQEMKKNVGTVVLDGSEKFFNVVTSYIYLNGYGVRQYWEMYYKCESGEVVTYLDFQNTVTNVHQQDMYILPATDGWKKVYIDLTDVVTWACGSADRVSVRLGMRGYKTSDSQKATFYFENVKLITMYAPY